jgi:hypothetical protein
MLHLRLLTSSGHKLSRRCGGQIGSNRQWGALVARDWDSFVNPPAIESRNDRLPTHVAAFTESRDLLLERLTRIAAIMMSFFHGKHDGGIRIEDL